jgi:acyl-coenzyme A thioesterase PaaI-like protein
VSVLADQTVLDRTGPGTYERETDRTWWGHESLFGGYGLALAAAAIEQEAARDGDDAGPLRTIRALTMHFLRPFVPGAFRAEVAIERTGRTLTTASARSSCDGKLCGIALATLAGERPSPTFLAAVVPAVEPIGAAEEPMAASPFVPSHRHFDFFPRFTEERTEPGPMVVGGWIRARRPEPLSVGMLCCYGDIWVPAVYHRLEAPVVAMSSDFTAHIRVPVPDPVGAPVDAHADPVLCLLRTSSAGHGFVDEDTELWTADGTLVAHTRQLRVLQQIELRPQAGG